MGIPNEDINMILSCLEEERYQDARDLLDEAIGKDINNHNLYYLKAVTCIQMNKLDEALIDLGEVAYLNPHHIPSMHALAFLFLKRGDFESAVNKWLAIITVSPSDALAKQNLKLVKEKKLIKNSLNQYNIDDFIVLDFKTLKKGMAFQFDVPSEKQKIIEATTYVKPPQTLQDVSLLLGQSGESTTYKTSFLNTLNFKSITLILFFLVCIIFSSVLIFRIHYGKESLQKNLRAFTQFLNIAPIQFSYTDEEIQKQKTIILSLLRENRYNQAKIAMNKIYFSNASIKEKRAVHMWESMLTLPEKPSDLDFQIDIKDALKNPAIYQGTYIATKGYISKFDAHEDYLSFLLVTKDQLEIPVITLDLSSSLNNNDVVDLFGKVSLDSKNHTLLIEAYNVSLNSETGLFL